MSTAAAAVGHSAEPGREPGEANVADVLVIFGITGDLAKVMTFRSLYRLEQRGLLNCPIVGVAGDDWTLEHLRKHARECIEGTGETVDEDVFDRFAARLSYVSGDFTDAATYERLAAAVGDAQSPVFYLEIPPFLFGPVIKQLTDAGLTKTAPRGRREAVRPRPRLRARAGGGNPSVHRRVAAVPDRPLPREDGHRRVPLPALRQHDDRADLEPQPHRVRADHDGRELRRRGPRALLRPGRRAARRGRQPPHAGGRARRDGGAGGQRRGNAQGREVRAVPRRSTTPSPAHYVRGQYDGYLDIDGVAKDSTTETYAALRLDIDNWRWSGVPWFIRTGKRLPVTQTELRAVFRDPPRLGLHGATAVAARSRTSSSSSSIPRRARA